jgi:hypothetical protein
MAGCHQLIKHNITYLSSPSLHVCCMSCPLPKSVVCAWTNLPTMHALTLPCRAGHSPNYSLVTHLHATGNSPYYCTCGQLTVLHHSLSALSGIYVKTTCAYTAMQGWLVCVGSALDCRPRPLAELHGSLSFVCLFVGSHKK